MIHITNRDYFLEKYYPSGLRNGDDILSVRYELNS
jgi:hypothetical protein